MRFLCHLPLVSINLAAFAMTLMCYLNAAPGAAFARCCCQERSVAKENHLVLGGWNLDINAWLTHS